MASDTVKRTGIPAMVGKSLAGFIRLVARTSTPVFDPPDLTERLYAAHPAIVAFWHGQFMMIRQLNTHDAPVMAMVARHGDADLIGSAMAELGVGLIRGAGAGGRKKDRGGAQALRASVKALADGHSLTMTADVPPGPARRAGDGIITIARLSGRPIVPVAVATSRFLALDTWSRMTINLPYSRLAAAMGEPIIVPREADAAMLETLRQRLETELNAATRRAYALAGTSHLAATPASALGPDDPPPPPGNRLKIYRGVTGALAPVLPLWLRLRERQGKEDATRRPERYGIASAARPAGPLIWLHAASVGETNVALPLIQALGEARPDVNFLLTTGTVTSADLARRRLGPRAIHQFVPLDAPRFARRFLDHWRPDLAIFTESEIWPNLILETSSRGTPLALVNARISHRSFSRWRRNSGIARPLFNRLALVLAQNERFSRWFSLLGARDVRNYGNIKIDSPPPPVDSASLERLRAAAMGRALLLAASTHPGEDEIVAVAHRLLVERHPGLLTIIVPRHPERGQPIADMLTAQGLRAKRRSLGELPDATTDIYIADTIGELGTFYALAPIAFIGGSLVKHGGQNPIEAVRHGAAVLTGPHTHNFTDAYNALLRAKGAEVVSDATTLADAASRLLTDADALAGMQRGAESALAGLAGALARTTDALLAMIARTPEVAVADR
ncbi:MAG: DUF374 domain-containing protein [Hyphomicrobiaceae bacterium]|nr:DUF374 domain-containing protein [Hyphomicrobiaceae bacterium]